MVSAANHANLTKIAFLAIIGSLPYLALLIPRARNWAILFLEPRSFVRSLITAVGAAAYSIVISYLLKVGHNGAAVVTALSYLSFIVATVYLNYRTGVNVNNTIANQNTEIGSLRNKNLILTKVNKLEKHVEQLIASKSKRFISCYKELKNMSSPVTGSDVFFAITKPDTQLKELYVIIKGVFEHIFCDPTESLEYSIMKPLGSRLEFVAYSRRPRSLDSAEYVAGTAFSKGSGYTANVAWEIEDMVIIEDIEMEIKVTKEKRNYQVTNKHDHVSEKGSMISFPIFDKEAADIFPDGLICVINITSSKPGVFVQRDKELYRYLIESFGCRIILERRLELLKGLIQTEVIANG